MQRKLSEEFKLSEEDNLVMDEHREESRKARDEKELQSVCISCKKSFKSFKTSIQGRKATDSLFCKPCIEAHEEQERDAQREYETSIE